MSIPIQVSPPTNDLTLSKDQAIAEVVKVTIPKSGIVPKVDVYFLADTTSSMAPAISAVKSGMMDILTQTQALGSDVQFGVGNYKDFPAPDQGRHPHAFQHQCSLSADIDHITAAVDTWETTPGRDIPEAQFYALDRVSEPPGGQIGWRADAKRIIVWIGDAGGHDPVCKAISSLEYDITEKSVTDKLVAEKITVLALSLESSGAPAGLDNPIEGVSPWYQDQCGNPLGEAGQGTRIANETGGKFVQGVSADTVVERITTELAAQIATIANVRLVASGATEQFVEAIAPAAGYGPLSRDQDYEISFDVSWLGTVEATSEVQVFNGSLDVVADGEVVGGKTVQITVEEIPMRPEDVSGTWMLIHQVTSAYLVPYGYNTTVNNKPVIWNLDPPHTTNGQVHLWVLVKQTDGTYLIQTFEKNMLDKEENLYLQAPAQVGVLGVDVALTLQKRSETDLQSWELVPVSSDPDTYGIRPKSFPDYAIGISGNGVTLNVAVVTNRSWGEPTFHQYWRLSKYDVEG